MQVSLKMVRKWGYKKIYSEFFPSNTETTFLSELTDLNTVLGDITDSAYSFVTQWNYSIDKSLDSYEGFKIFADFICDELLSGSITVSAKRRFNYNWVELWSEFGRAIECYPFESNLYASLGIRLALCDKEIRISSDNVQAMSFFNSVLCWFVVAKKMDSLDISMDKKYLDLIEKLIVSSSYEFVYGVLPEFMLEGSNVY